MNKFLLTKIFQDQNALPKGGGVYAVRHCSWGVRAPGTDRLVLHLILPRSLVLWSINVHISLQYITVSLFHCCFSYFFVLFLFWWLCLYCFCCCYIRCCVMCGRWLWSIHLVAFNPCRHGGAFSAPPDGKLWFILNRTSVGPQTSL